MLVEIGNLQPHQFVGGQPIVLPHGQPAVTSVHLDDTLTCAPGAQARDLLAHMGLNPAVTRLPDQEMFVTIMHGQQGVWSQHGTGTPEWVHCESDVDPEKAAELERLLADAWSCARGRPADVEDRYHTLSGPPGVGPDPEVAE